jgi:hypothetical protein
VDVERVLGLGKRKRIGETEMRDGRKKYQKETCYLEARGTFTREEHEEHLVWFLKDMIRDMYLENRHLQFEVQELKKQIRSLALGLSRERETERYHRNRKREEQRVRDDVEEERRRNLAIVNMAM